MPRRERPKNSAFPAAGNASAGINQTRHRIYLELSCDVYILMPSGSKRVSVAAQVVVSECLIVGVVPNSYVYVDDTDKMLNLIPD